MIRSSHGPRNRSCNCSSAISRAFFVSSPRTTSPSALASLPWRGEAALASAPSALDRGMSRRRRPACPSRSAAWRLPCIWR
jgi:hypothetical protein